MRSLIHPPSKSRVTRVTGVTLATNPLNLLALSCVTRLSVSLYTSCNAAATCNAKVSPPLLRAAVRSQRLKREFRWLRVQVVGRGIERYTMFETLEDD